MMNYCFILIITHKLTPPKGFDQKSKKKNLLKNVFCYMCVQFFFMPISMFITEINMLFVLFFRSIQHMAQAYLLSFYKRLM